MEASLSLNDDRIVLWQTFPESTEAFSEKQFARSA